jgi:hypothetical protein
MVTSVWKLLFFLPYLGFFLATLQVLALVVPPFFLFFPFHLPSPNSPPFLLFLLSTSSFLFLFYLPFFLIFLNFPGINQGVPLDFTVPLFFFHYSAGHPLCNHNLFVHVHFKVLAP